jgi:hypothetical protein
MKKITLILGLTLMSLAGYAQESQNDSNDLQNQERESTYIIVLDDTVVDDNIDMLLKGSELHADDFALEPSHELVHDEQEDFSLEGKLVEGAYSYNEYAINHKPGSRVSVATS